MNVMLVMAVLLGTDAPLDDGTLLFLEHGNPVVEVYTKKEITHVGVILSEDGTTWLYEAVPGKVRRVPVAKYYQEIGDYNRGRKQPASVQLRTPLTKYTDEQLNEMRNYLHQQIDRRYSVKNYLRARPGDGIHCAELTASTLNRSGRFRFEQSFLISPGELFQQVDSEYNPSKSVALSTPAPKSWCKRSQDWWTGMFTWCGWSCGEAWSFCR